MMAGTLKGYHDRVEVFLAQSANEKPERKAPAMFDRTRTYNHTEGKRFRLGYTSAVYNLGLDSPIN